MKEFYNNRKAFTLAEVKSSRGTNEVRGELASTKTVAEPHLLTKIWFNLVNVGQQVFRCKSERCRLTRDAGGRAFTLAEVLIALGIIGIVAAMTIPSLIMKYKEKSWATSSTVFERKFEESLKVMNSQGVLGGRVTTENFVNELAKYMKISKICQNSELNQCFSNDFLFGTGKIQKSTSDFLKSSKFVLKPFSSDTNTLGIMFANGVNALLAYNPACPQNQFSNTISMSECISMIYDVSGSSLPNEYGKDIQAINVTKIPAFKAGNVSFSAPIQPAPLTYQECLNVKDELGIQCCEECGDKDYFAGAVKACQGIQNMPNFNQLTEIADELYNTHNTAWKVTDGLQINEEKALSYGVKFDTSDKFVIIGNTHSTGAGILARYYGKTFTQSSGAISHRGLGNKYTICITD